MKIKIKTIHLVKDGHIVIVNDPSRNKDHFLSLGYIDVLDKPRSEPEPEPEPKPEPEMEEAQEEVKPKRKRRTKAEIEADKQSQ